MSAIMKSRVGDLRHALIFPSAAEAKRVAGAQVWTKTQLQ